MVLPPPPKKRKVRTFYTEEEEDAITKYFGIPGRTSSAKTAVSFVTNAFPSVMPEVPRSILSHPLAQPTISLRVV